MNKLQRKYRQQQLALDKVRGKKLINKRRKFQWKKYHTKSLPELKQEIRQDVKPFAPEVEKEMKQFNSTIDTIANRYKNKNIVVNKKICDFDEMKDDVWKLEPIKNRLVQRMKKDLKYVQKLHERLEVACNRLTISTGDGGDNNNNDNSNNEENNFFFLPFYFNMHHCQ